MLEPWLKSNGLLCLRGCTVTPSAGTSATQPGIGLLPPRHDARTAREGFHLCFYLSTRWPSAWKLSRPIKGVLSAKRGHWKWGQRLSWIHLRSRFWFEGLSIDAPSGMLSLSEVAVTWPLCFFNPCNGCLCKRRVCCVDPLSSVSCMLISQSKHNPNFLFSDRGE